MAPADSETQNSPTTRTSVSDSSDSTLLGDSSASTHATSATPSQLPLVILPRVLFPQTFMPLNVLEPRYERMVKECLKAETGTGILYRDPGAGPELSDRQLDRLQGQIGTYGVISDWYPQPDQTLTLSIDGIRRFEVLNAVQESDGLIRADVRWLDEETPESLAERHQGLTQLLQQITHHPLAEAYQLSFDALDATALSLQLAHFLPFCDADKQQLLSTHSAAERLDQIQALLDQQAFLSVQG